MPVEPVEKDLHKPGVKDDAGKPRMHLITEGFPRALLAVGDVATFGAGKYSDHGWVSVPGAFSRYTSAMLRHHLAEGAESADVDEDSQLEHIAMVAWNALARLELHLRHKARENPFN